MVIDFSNIERNYSISDILAHVSEETIYKTWCKEFPSSNFSSPFRKDKNPSFGFYKSNNRWRWKDLGGNGDSGDVWDFVAMAEGTDLKSAIKIVAERFNLTNGNTIPVLKTRKTYSINPEKEIAASRSRALIQVRPRMLTDKDYEWWNRILITPQIMRMYYIRAAQEVWVNKKLNWFHKDDNPIYYYLSPVSQNIKCYRPLEPNKRFKWLSNQDPLKDIQGYYQCRIKQWPGRPLLLVKSLKEVAFFRAFHINAMANTGEHVHYSEDFIRHIKKYCWPIMYLGDNDWPGMRAVVKIWKGYKNYKGYGIPGMIIPRKWGAKDPTDLWLHDYRKVYDLLNNIYDNFKHLRASGKFTYPTV